MMPQSNPVRIIETATHRDGKKGGEEVASVRRETHLPEDVTAARGELAFARFGVRQTLNLGNFESLALEVSVETPCLPGSEPEGLAYAKSIAVSALKQFRAEALGEAS
jgi:hypothetical protein